MLYVGISETPMLRATNHARLARWASFAATAEVRWYDTRLEAEAWEQFLIRTKVPIFNIKHAANDPQTRIEKYLQERGWVW